MHHWSQNGFAELGDKGGMGIGQTTRRVLHHPNFQQITTHQYAKYHPDVKDLPNELIPGLPSIEIWTNAGRDIAPNGAIMRTSCLGCLQFPCMSSSPIEQQEMKELEDARQKFKGSLNPSVASTYPYSPSDFHSLDPIHQLTCALCLVTHADARCLVSCIALVEIIRALVNRPSTSTHERSTSFPKEDLDRILQSTAQISESWFVSLPEKQQELYHKEFLFHSQLFQTVEELQLDERNKIGYTFKCMGAAFYALRCDMGETCYGSGELANQSLFRSVLTKVVREGGDADTNGAVCGSVLGARIGYLSLPRDWLQGLRPQNKRWLDRLAVSFLKAQQLL